MKIIVEIKNIYGREVIYPVCDTAKNLSKLIGTKTLTLEALHIIKELGYEIEVETQKLTLTK